jgi:hypothetical protein
LDARDEDCGTPVHYDVEIPHRDDNFFVEKVYYRPVASGRRITLELEGTFGTQIGVLVNGTPLQKVVAIGQPMLEQTAFNVPGNAGETGIAGVFEMVGSKQIIMSFVMPGAFVGTPRIAIVTPAREAVINSYSIDILNGGTGSARGRLDGPEVAPMFYQNPTIVRATPAYLAADDTSPNETANQSVLLSLFGQGFLRTTAHTMIINGDVLTEQIQSNTVPTPALKPGEYQIVNSSLVQTRFDRQKYYPNWHIDYLVNGTDQTIDAPASYDDDGPPTVSACQIKEIKEKGAVTAVEVVLKGKYFNAAYTPVALNKNVALKSTVLTSAEAWGVSLAVPEGSDWKQGVLQLKGSKPAYSPQIRLDSCPVSQ